MPPAVDRAAQKVAYSPLVTAALRIVQFATPLVLSAVLWVGGNYLAGQTAAMAAVTLRVTQVEQFDTAADRRVTQLETQAQLGRADRLAFQDKAGAALEKIVDQNASLQAQVAGLIARLDEADRAAARH